MWASLFVINLICVTLAQIILPPFRQISHDIQSGPIEINNDTILIKKFYFDGVAPKAYFLVGKGQPAQNGTKITRVSYSNTSTTLPVFSNANITLKLPDEITLADIDYLSVWCEEFQISLGHVFTKERWVSRTNSSGIILPKTIGSFKKTTNGVSCESITLLDQTRIVITGFNYHGNNSAQFWVGKESPSPNGLPVYLKTGGTVFTQTSNTNITVVIPKNNTILDFDYLAVWGDDNTSYGHVFFTETTNDMEKYMGQQFEGFENHQYGLKSGPIIRVNKNTIYITNFRFRGFGNKQYFWVGLEKNDPHLGHSIPNQKGEHNSPISADEGSSFYLTLSGLAENEVNFFGIWDAESKALIVRINFMGDGEDVPAKITVDGRRIIRYPKCCPHKFMITENGCSPTDLILDSSIPVYYANTTHLNTDPMIPDRVMFVPYLNNLSCPRYFLNPDDEDDKFLYLTTGTLLFPSGNQEQYNQDNFCLDIVEADGEIYHTTLICHTQYGMMEGWRIAICVCVFLSAICLFITAGTFFLVTDRDDMRGISVAGFSGCMGVAFFCLFLTQTGLESEKWCNALGFIFQFFIVSSLIWLDALCYEMYYNITNYNTDKILGTYKRRAITYFIIATIFPLIFVVTSIIIGVPVGLINVNLDKNCFLNVSSKKWLLYSPILATILIAAIVTIYNIHLYRTVNFKHTVNSEGRDATFWKHSKKDIKTRLVQSMYLVLFTCAFWLSEVITYALESPWDALDILHALQGVLTLLIVLTTGKTFAKLKDTLKKRLCCKKKASKGYYDEHDETRGTELTLMNNNGNVNNPS